MDLLFKRYASPFLILDEMISNNRFTDFIHELSDIKQEENEYEDDKLLWDFWVHNIEGQTFSEFKNGHTQQEYQEITEEEIKETINDSRNTLEGFNPE